VVTTYVITANGQPEERVVFAWPHRHDVPDLERMLLLGHGELKQQTTSSVLCLPLPLVNVAPYTAFSFFFRPLVSGVLNK
jgi:hypothetical protein